MNFYDIEWTDSYQITVEQELFEQVVINRFFYRATSTYSGALNDVVSTFRSLWNTYVPLVQTDELTCQELRILELFGDRQQAAIQGLGGEGQDNGAALPQWFAFTWRLWPSDTRVRKGHKRIAGVCEQAVDGNTLNSGYQDRIDDITSFLANSLSVSGTEFLPTLLSPENSIHSGNLAPAVAVAQFTGFTTQSSRKTGRGA